MSRMGDEAGAGQTGWLSYGEGFRPRETPPRPAWFEPLVRLMVHGPGREDHLAGIVRAWVEDEGGTEFHYRVYRRGDLYRCESLDGRVHAIAGRDVVWQPGPEQSEMRSAPRRGFVAAPEDYEFGLARPDEDRWIGDDFTVPIGPPRRVQYLDHAAWEVELAPPPHKPFPMQMLIDADTGLVLREGNAEFGTFHEWVEVDTEADLPDHLFTCTSTDRVARRFG
jgi:hypothetical protein